MFVPYVQWNALQTALKSYVMVQRTKCFSVKLIIWKVNIMCRIANVERKTSETEIKIKMNLDGVGKYNISTGVNFFNHMLESFSKHSMIDLDIIADGDIEIDDHHTIEDVGIGGVSAIGIYLLNNIRRNVFANIGAGLWDTYNMATGLMGDLLSYLRLYALGLAGGMLGGVFNTLGMQLRDTLGDFLFGIPGWICFGLIFVAGHGLNIALSCLSGYVHSIRLTFVEYFKNSGYDGKGMEYKPFSSKKENE